MTTSDGIVYLVGAGPGDARLVTRRALELIERADVILHDRLIPPGLLERAREGVELIDVGKRPGRESTDQREIERLLVEHARRGHAVVRLKGGDPFVFGRGGEEAEALAEAGVRFEVVPGVTAGVAGPALAGIPVTHRNAASAVALVTAHEDPSKQDGALDWAALARFPGTLVFYMGVRNLGDVARTLIEHGRSPHEPAAVIERASLPGQRTIGGPLSAIAEIAEAEAVRAPAVMVVGAVAALRERLAWIESAPLHGRTVVVTRARAQASELSARLVELGAAVVEVPAIRIRPRLEDPDVSDAVRRLADGAFDVVCLTSPNGARLLLEALAGQDRDARSLAGTTIAAIGPGTARELRAAGLRADVVPERSVAEALAQVLVEGGVEGRRVLLARAAEGRDVLPERLREAGADTTEVALYETLTEQLDEQRLSDAGDADYITFTSSSTVRNFVAAIGGPERMPQRPRVVSIGPVTTATARELGIEVHVEAKRHDIDGLVAALLEDAGP